MSGDILKLKTVSIDDQRTYTHIYIYVTKSKKNPQNTGHYTVHKYHIIPHQSLLKCGTIAQTDAYRGELC